jgi:hypothetical protein
VVGATSTTPARPAAGLGAAAAVVVMLGAAAVYAGWWLMTPGDCTALTPAVGDWRVDGVRPELRGSCESLREGDLVVSAAQDPAGVAYRVRREGVEVVAVEPQGAPHTRLDIDPTSLGAPTDSARLASDLFHNLHAEEGDRPYVDPDGYRWWGEPDPAPRIATFLP